jgi:hypothetical protein
MVVEVVLHQLEPAGLDLLRHFRVSVSGQVDQPTLRVELEEVDELSPARSAADAREPRTLHDRIDGGRFAGIGTTGKGDFAAGVGGKLVGFGRTRQESHVGIDGHRE